MGRVSKDQQQLICLALSAWQPGPWWHRLLRTLLMARYCGAEQKELP